jgi:hypothetical protein
MDITQPFTTALECTIPAWPNNSLCGGASGSRTTDAEDPSILRRFTLAIHIVSIQVVAPSNGIELLSVSQLRVLGRRPRVTALASGRSMKDVYARERRQRLRADRR